jgi:hypothetical protein
VTATDIADWAIQRYGYFIKADADKIETQEALAKELAHLPSNCLSFIDKAKHKWFDDGNKRPPAMADFLALLRGFNNSAFNTNKNPKIDERQVDYAGIWDNAKTDEQRKNYMKTTFNRREASDATKYWIRKWLRNIGCESNRIKAVLGLVITEKEKNYHES